MITSRLVQHLKQQHWTGVFIELLIVILGVFIGLQVNNWNEQRQDNALEKQYLQRLHDDIQLSINAANYNIHDMRSQYRFEGIMLADLAACRLEGAEKNRFATGAYAFGKLDPLPLVRGTIDELRSTGRIGLIRDVRLRTQLAKVVERTNFWRRVLTFIMARASPAIFYVNKRIELKLSLESFQYGDFYKHGMPDGSFQFDFPALCKNPQFAAVVSNVQELTEEVIYINQERLASFKKLLKTIDRDLDGKKGDR